MGARGWGFRHVLPYFKRMESSHGGEEDWRGTGGPLHVTRGAMRNPLYQAFIDAGRQAGYPLTPDYNGRQQEGLGPFEMTVWRGRRWSTANAYLRPSLKRSNVRLETRALVRRILLEGKRATGVEYEHRRRDQDRASQSRCRSRRQRRQFAEAAHAVRHRARRSSAGNGRHRRSSSPGGRPEPA